MSANGPVYEALARLRARFEAAGAPVPRELTKAIAAVERVPAQVRPRIGAALVERTPTLAMVLPVCADDPLCPAYPKATQEHQSRLALGEKPKQILRGLTDREAHQALTAGYDDPVVWLLSEIVGPCPVSLAGRPAPVHDVPTARWLIACWNDPARRTALQTEREVRGPAGEVIRGRLLERIDEITRHDLAHGASTGVREAFEAAGKRAYDRWCRDAERQHEALAPTPRWWKPLRCARLLQSAAALVAEGRAMQHCVGMYAAHVRAERSVIVSLCVRARGETYRSTAELDRSTRAVRQHRGVGNAEAPALCQRALAVLLRQFGN